MALDLREGCSQVYGDDSRWVVTRSHLLTLHIVLVSAVQQRGCEQIELFMSPKGAPKLQTTAPPPTNHNHASNFQEIRFFSWLQPNCLLNQL